jgi:CheY-like chemotaxis protein
MTKILVIDDDPAVRGAFKLVLEEDGFLVSEAESGLHGIEMVKAERPDLILLDLRMPGIDGVETLRRLKALDATLHVYIVTAFANEFMEQLRIAHDEGLQFQLASKPLSSSQIRQIARSVQRLSETDKVECKLLLTLYIISITPDIKKLIERITSVLSVTYEPGRWVFDVVEVLDMPEKALEREVFATPMLVRDLPAPVVKLLGDLSQMPLVLAAITTQHSNGSGTVIL